MQASDRPLVSVGVPVFNGEAGLAKALDSVLQQDYPNLEVVISDNGSTDGTPEICRRYARMDPRVQWWRSEQNRGAVWNFNRVFELSSGKYFVWAAHDDLRAPSFVSACVERMEECRDAVLCHAHTEVTVEGHDEPVYVAHLDTFAADLDVVARYRETLTQVPPHVIYGLYRSSAMRATGMFAPVIATDLAFVLELSIHGRFVEVPRTLFTYRARPTWNTIHDDARTFLGVAKKPWWYLPFVMLFIDHSRRLLYAPIPPGLKLRLWSVLARYESGQLAFKAALRLAGLLCPEGSKEALARAVYWRWMHNPNLRVVSPALFFDRMCKPRFGWWR